MNVSCRAQGFELSSAIDMFVRKEVHSTLDHFSEEIVSVDVFMKDTNGPKGGVDKQVLMRIQIRGRQQITMQTIREDLYAAIRISTKRAKRAVRRSLRKARRFEKLSLRRLAIESPQRDMTEA
ncbi:MAG: HPF/RaiA family ribosome-associated protein [Woeseiaceae bacterium]|nr:HPF/RaiA family ribosome-associated protein [Woeseiaceae bacterium]